MQEQFLGKPSIIKENFDAIEKEKFEKIDIEKAKEEIKTRYSR